MKKVIDRIIHFVTPHDKNNYKSRPLHIDFLSLYLVFALFMVFFSKGISSQFFNVLGFATDISTTKLFELTNTERAKKNLSPLQYNEKLSLAAEKKAQDMFAKNYWSHYSPDGKTPWDFILASNYQYEYAGENLAKNFLFSNGVVDAWMNSPSHRENLLKKEYAEVGYAIVNGVLNGEETTLVVQMFGTPLKNGIAPVPQTQQENQIAVKELPSEPNTPAVLGKERSKPTFNFLYFSFDAIYVYLFLFITVLLIDFYVASKLNVVRISGKNVAHLIFLTVIFVGVAFILKQGAII